MEVTQWSTSDNQSSVAPAQRVWWQRSAVVGGALTLASVFYAMGVQVSVHSTDSIDRRSMDGEPNCYEDEVYAIQIDTSPNHGLTWACENIERFILRSNAD